MLFEPSATITDVKFSQGTLQKSKSIFVPGCPFHSLSYHLTGSASIDFQDQTLISKQGSLTFIPKDFDYRTTYLETQEIMVISFICMEEYESLFPMVIMPKHPRLFENHFKTLAEIYRPGMNKDYQNLSLVYRILADFENQFPSEHTSVIPSRMLETKEYIDYNFHLPLSISELAFRASVSESYFRKEFKQYFGLSPVAYIQKVRIENAKSMLLVGCYQVSEIATQCGFDNISYFSYVFRNHTGMTPSEYRGH